MVQWRSLPFETCTAMPSKAPTPAWQALPPDARALRLAWGLGWPLAMAATPWWLAHSALGVGCGFRALTGLPCPLCGGTHACAALVQGDLAAAWAANPGALVLLLWLALLAGQALAEGVSGRRRLQRWPWWHPTVVAGVGGVLVLSWLARLFL